MKYTKHSPQQCSRVKQLREQGISYRIISERMGFSVRMVRYLESKVR